MRVPASVPLQVSAAVPEQPIPVILPDLPISAALLFLFLAGLAAHIACIWRAPRTNPLHHADPRLARLSLLVAVFCALRLATMSIRVAWATAPASPPDASRAVGLALADDALVAAAAPLLYIANLGVAHALFRARHPHLPWKWCAAVAVAGYALAAAVLLLVALLADARIQTALQLWRMAQTQGNPHMSADSYGVSPLQVDATLQRAGTTLLAIIAALPIVLVVASALDRKKRSDEETAASVTFSRPTSIPISMTSTTALITASAPPTRVVLEPYSSEGLGTALWTLGTVSVVLLFHASWDAAMAWMPVPAPLTPRPAHWFAGKPAWYTVHFVSELLAVFILLAAMWLPNLRDRVKEPKPKGEKKKPVKKPLAEKAPVEQDAVPAAAPPTPEELEEDEEEPGSQPARTPSPASTVCVFAEGELFDNSATLADTLAFGRTSILLDKNSGQWAMKRKGEGPGSGTGFASGPGSLNGARHAGEPSRSRPRIIDAVDEPAPRRGELRDSQPSLLRPPRNSTEAAFDENALALFQRWE